ncbi:hypothetical protein CK203_022083 [Vitis vinifera]|uniref:Uncharacterized protein n=1 Tax=Vitis vinifera TaxID=29760 RepID=A0A438FZY5_VITVI|nr:hypothetical protein CK203_022083 [Vitis vinifera]
MSNMVGCYYCNAYIDEVLNFGLYLHAVTETKLVVDTSRGETLRINDICGFASQL